MGEKGKPMIRPIFDIIREVARNSDLKIKRGFADFIADRLIQATTQPTLLSMIEKLAGLLNAKIDSIDSAKMAIFMENINSDDSKDVLNWLREYPRVTAMIVTQGSNDYEECIKDIDIPASAIEKGVAFPTTIPEISIEIMCLSPLAHGADTKAGNATIFRRMQVLSTTGQVLSLPFYAGNALRGQMRDLLADHYLKALGLVPRKDNPPCNLWFFHSLYAGGALEENSTQEKALSKKLGNNGSLRAEGIYELRDRIPPISVLGTALGNRVLSGRVNFCDFRPQCLEWGNGNVSVGNLFEWTYLTRREDYENHKDGDNSSMIANTECLKSGTVLVGGIDISNHVTDIERACIGKGLSLIQESGYIGAESRRGFGKVEVKISNLPDPSIYDEYIEDNKEQILVYLEDIGAINASSGTYSGCDI